MPMPVGVAGRSTRRVPSTSVTSTGVSTGTIAWVAASEIATSMSWSLTASAWQKRMVFHSSPSRSSRSAKPVLMIRVLMASSS